MDKKQLIIDFNKILEEGNLFKALSIENVNYNPHPFTIRAEHIKRYALDTTRPCAGYVNGNQYSNVKKPGFTKCGLSLEEHTFDIVVFLQLKRNGNNNEANVEMKKLPLIENKIDGVVMIETKEEFRITGE